jgi:hypothetical protein
MRGEEEEEERRRVAMHFLSHRFEEDKRPE